MATIKLTITVEQLANVLSLFDVIKIYRSTAGVGGPYSEITSLGTRVNLATGVTVYQYDDTAGDPAYYYKTSYFNETNLLESSLSDPIQGSQQGTYISIQDVRDEGVTVAKASDAKVLALIETYQALIERITRQWFVARQMTWDFDGNGSSLAQFPVPIISVTALYANDDFVNAVDASQFKAYTGRGENGPDDRKNPKIRLVTGEEDFFAGTGSVQYTRFVFRIGEKNCRLVGSFGYVEPDGSVPAPITYALKKLVVAKAMGGPMAGMGAFPGGPLVEEETDRHRRRYADPYVGSKAFPVSGTGDQEVDLIISAYRAPIVVKTQRTAFRRFTGRSI